MAQEEMNEGGSFADQIESEMLSDVVGGEIDLPGDDDPFKDTYGQDDLDTDQPAAYIGNTGQDHSPVMVVQGIDPNDLNAIRNIPGYQLFKDAYQQFISDMCQQVLTLQTDDDRIAILFKEQLERKMAQNHIDATREWADQQGAVVPAGWVPLNESGHDFVKSESGTLDEPLGQLDVPVAPATPDMELPGDLTEGELAVLQTEKTIRELQGDVERLEQESIRNSDAVLHWQEVSDMFNTFMAEDGVEATNDPLTVRVARYVADLRERSARLAGLEK
jgi:hypothetical protein